MRASFQLDENIAIVVHQSYFDLHNCFDFIGYEYHVADRKVRLEWKRAAGDWVAKELPQRLVLSFEGVTKIATKRRDVALPCSEDRCVASIAFLPPALSENYSITAPGYRSEEEHFSIEFQSGSGIKVWAESVTLEVPAD